MPAPLFATPDFGAGATAACIILVFFLAAASVTAVVLLFICWRISKIKSRKQRWAAAASLAAVALLVCFCVWLYDFKPYADFDSLLAGSKDIRIERVEFDGHQKKAVLTDPTANNYLTDKMRVAERNEFEGGVTYDARLYLSSGNSVTCAIYIPDGKKCLTIRYPIETLTEGSYYLVSLPEPVPYSLSQVIAELK